MSSETEMIIDLTADAADAADAVDAAADAADAVDAAADAADAADAVDVTDAQAALQEAYQLVATAIFGRHQWAECVDSMAHYLRQVVDRPDDRSEVKLYYDLVREVREDFERIRAACDNAKELRRMLEEEGVDTAALLTAMQEAKLDLAEDQAKALQNWLFEAECFWY
jgi:hypothetical protein